MEYTLAGSIAPEVMIEPQTMSSTRNGTKIDSLEFQSFTLLARVANVTGRVTFEVQHSDTTTSGDFTEVPESDLYAVMTPVEIGDSATRWCGYHGKKRYVRLVVHGACDVCAFMLKGHPEETPTLGENVGKQFENYG